MCAQIKKKKTKNGKKMNELMNEKFYMIFRCAFVLEINQTNKYIDFQR